MSQFNFIISCLDSNGHKYDESVSFDSHDYQQDCARNYAILMHNYPPDQAETHILATKKNYISQIIANQVGEQTPARYDVAEIINTLDRDVKHLL